MTINMASSSPQMTTQSPPKTGNNSCGCEREDNMEATVQSDIDALKSCIEKCVENFKEKTVSKQPIIVVLGLPKSLARSTGDLTKSAAASRSLNNSTGNADRFRKPCLCSCNNNNNNNNNTSRFTSLIDEDFSSLQRATKYTGCSCGGDKDGKGGGNQMPNDAYANSNTTAHSHSLNQAFSSNQSSVLRGMAAISSSSSNNNNSRKPPPSANSIPMYKSARSSSQQHYQQQQQQQQQYIQRSSFEERLKQTLHERGLVQQSSQQPASSLSNRVSMQQNSVPMQQSSVAKQKSTVARQPALLTNGSYSDATATTRRESSSVSSSQQKEQQLYAGNNNNANNANTSKEVTFSFYDSSDSLSDTTNATMRHHLQQQQQATTTTSRTQLQPQSRSQSYNAPKQTLAYTNANLPTTTTTMYTGGDASSNEYNARIMSTQMLNKVVDSSSSEYNNSNSNSNASTTNNEFFRGLSRLESKPEPEFANNSTDTRYVIIRIYLCAAYIFRY